MNTHFTTVEDKMKSVKTMWDSTPAGPKKATALTLYQAAESAKIAKDDAQCLKYLDAATAALA